MPNIDLTIAQKPKAMISGEIVDHLPLFAEFRVTKLTQELGQILNRRGRDES